MTLEEHRELTSQLLERQPGLVFDTLAMYQRRHGAPPFAGVPGVPWCTCGNFRDMPTDLERKCCGQDPKNCVSLLPHFSQYCLTEGFLHIHRQYREDITVLGQASGPGDDNREYRYAAYRHFIYWQHGSLGQGNRRVIPSCCVWRIRDRFPDPQGHYTGFVPGI
uniref:P2X purinoreceptor 7 intracellular domain-containing protein n=1 Tax=Myripristis murdjan TaxID=586833 RepID=A0A668A4C7_9TELE